MATENKELIERLVSYGGDSKQDQDCLEASKVIEHVEGILHDITAWYDAYPRAVFVEPTKEQWLEAHHLLNKVRTNLLVAISASRRKHVLDGIHKIIGSKRPSKDDE